MLLKNIKIFLLSAVLYSVSFSSFALFKIEGNFIIRGGIHQTKYSDVTNNKQGLPPQYNAKKGEPYFPLGFIDPIYDFNQPHRNKHPFELVVPSDVENGVERGNPRGVCSDFILKPMPDYMTGDFSAYHGIGPRFWLICQEPVIRRFKNIIKDNVFVQLLDPLLLEYYRAGFRGYISGDPALAQGMVSFYWNIGQYAFVMSHDAATRYLSENVALIGGGAFGHLVEGRGTNSYVDYDKFLGQHVGSWRTDYYHGDRNQHTFMAMDRQILENGSYESVIIAGSRNHLFSYVDYYEGSDGHPRHDAQLVQRGSTMIGGDKRTLVAARYSAMIGGSSLTHREQGSDTLSGMVYSFRSDLLETHQFLFGGFNNVVLGGRELVMRNSFFNLQSEDLKTPYSRLQLNVWSVNHPESPHFNNSALIVGRGNALQFSNNSVILGGQLSYIGWDMGARNGEFQMSSYGLYTEQPYDPDEEPKIGLVNYKTRKNMRMNYYQMGAAHNSFMSTGGEEWTYDKPGPEEIDDEVAIKSIDERQPHVSAFSSIEDDAHNSAIIGGPDGRKYVDIDGKVYDINPNPNFNDYKNTVKAPNSGIFLSTNTTIEYGDWRDNTSKEKTIENVKSGKYEQPPQAEHNFDPNCPFYGFTNTLSPFFTPFPPNRNYFYLKCFGSKVIMNSVDSMIGETMPVIVDEVNFKLRPDELEYRGRGIYDVPNSVIINGTDTVIKNKMIEEKSDSTGLAAPSSGLPSGNRTFGGITAIGRGLLSNGYNDTGTYPHTTQLIVGRYNEPMDPTITDHDQQALFIVGVGYKNSIDGVITRRNGFVVYRSGRVAAQIGYSQPSDKKLKKNIKPIPYGLSEVLSLKPVKFEWKNQQINAKGKKIGFIAQEVEPIIPELIRDDPNSVDKIKSMRYSKLIPVLIKAIQEQKIQIDKQQSQIIQLKNNINKLYQSHLNYNDIDINQQQKTNGL